MLEQLVALNNMIYMLLNSAFANPLLDQFFLAVTEFGSVYFWILLMIFFAIRKEKKPFIALLLALFLSNIMSLFLKELFATPRPDTGRQLAHESTYGFPSAHSSNAFAGAFVLDKLYRGYTVFLYAFAALIAVSRVYLGVHYPSHILFGSFMGIAIGYAVMKLPLDDMVRSLEKRVRKRKK